MILKSNDEMLKREIAEMQKQVHTLQIRVKELDEENHQLNLQLDFYKSIQYKNESV
tara:strand:- start:282 stop:449 length:168 start_codon:yes stop_codon:yes gene_type:complete